MTVRDNHYTEYDSRSPSSRQAERDKLAAQTAEFISRGGSIQQVARPTMDEIKTSFVDSGRFRTEQNQINAQKHKHQFLLNWESAREAGRETFIGMVCKKCGGSERWVVGKRSCITCFPKVDMCAKSISMHARKAARQAYEPTYIGQPCGFCGCTTRNTQSGACDDTWKHPAMRRANKQAKQDAEMQSLSAASTN